MLSYGRIITEEVYRDGSIVNGIVHTESSIKLDGLQELWNNLIQQVGRLKTEDSITLTIECERHTREPNRMVVNSKRLLK